MTKRYFITGTDTGVGKTYISVLLLNLLISQNQRVLGLKPLALGSDAQFKNKNADAIALQQASNIKVGYEEVNPFMLETAAAPHVAFVTEKRIVTKEQMVSSVNQTIKRHRPDTVLIEGVGGWRVPLGSQENMVDVALGLTDKIILVIGLRLGCLNHGLLTYESILASGATCAGWIVNQIDPTMPFQTENIKLLKTMITAPFFGMVNYHEKIGHNCLNLSDMIIN